MTFKIEPVRRYLVGHKPEPNRPHHVFDHSSKGFLVTGYEDGSDWLVSPLGREVYGYIVRNRPDTGWAIAADRREYHRLHLYILDFPSKSFRQVPGFWLTRDYDTIDYDGERLLFLCPPAAEPESDVIELAIIDIASAQIADRYPLEGLTHLFRTTIGLTPEGWLVMSASRLNENNKRLYVHGLARIHPLTRETAFETFPSDGRKPFRFSISPSGRYILQASQTLPLAAQPACRFSQVAEAGEAGNLYERSIEVWTGSPLSHNHNLPLEWVRTDDAWEVSHHINGGGSARLFWQPDESAFWWETQKKVICVGMDGHSSPPIRTKAHASIFKALPDRIAELTFERETIDELYRLDGAPLEDLSPLDAPAPTVLTPSAAEVKRQRKAQADLRKIVSQKSDLRFSVKMAGEEAVVAAIDSITSALEKGLGWFADEDGRIKLAVKIDGATYNEKRFFALVEKLGPVAVPALRRLLARCRGDKDFPNVWSSELEDGQQAFGHAAKALGGLDPSTWPDLAEYEKCINDYHELYFRANVLPHFLKSHGWREESFIFALADIVQMRGNLGDDFVYAWRRSGLAAAAEAQYSPAAFAELMLSVRDQMLCSLTGSFAVFAARVAAAAPAHGWHNYDRLFGQIKGSLSPWEALVFEELKLWTASSTQG